MGQCALCGNEVKEEPYREPAPMPKEKPATPKVQRKSEPRQHLNIINRVALYLASAGGLIWALSMMCPTGIRWQMGIHLGLGVLALAIAIPIAHLIFIRFPEAVGRLSRGDTPRHNSFFDTDWDEGAAIIIGVPICLAALGGMIYLVITILVRLGYFINTLL